MNDSAREAAAEIDERALSRLQISLLSVAEGFLESSVLFALNRLDIFNVIDNDEKSLDDIALATGCEAATLSRLLKAGVATKFLEKAGEASYRVSEVWKPVLLKSSGDGYLGSWLNFLHYLSASMVSLHEASTRGGPTLNLLGDRQDEDIREFILAMHNYAIYRGRDLARYLGTTNCKSLLDLGCGPGTYAYHLARANPNLELYLLDLPEVLEVARDVANSQSLTNTIHFLPVDVTKEDIPGSYDMVLVSNTLHMLGEDDSRKLIRRLFDHVTPGGSLVIQAQFLNEDGTGERWPVMLDLAQLCVTHHGRNHAVEETRNWLEEAGFVDIEYSRMGLLNTNAYLRGYRP